MSYATIYVTQEDVYLKIPTFNRIFLLHCLLSMNFYWTQVGFETH